jgi:hypothetical protein
VDMDVIHMEVKRDTYRVLMIAGSKGTDIKT